MYKNSHSRLDGLKLHPDYKKWQVKNNTTQNFKMWDQKQMEIYTICPTHEYNRYAVPKRTQTLTTKINFKF